MMSRAYGARRPRSHYDVIRYWAGHAHRYGRTYVRTDILPRLLYKDAKALDEIPTGSSQRRRQIQTG